jgi:hypothetical protein
MADYRITYDPAPVVEAVRKKMVDQARGLEKVVIDGVAMPGNEYADRLQNDYAFFSAEAIRRLAPPRDDPEIDDLDDPARSL